MNSDYTFPTEKPISDKMLDFIRLLLAPDPRERPSVDIVLQVIENWSSSVLKLPNSCQKVKNRQEEKYRERAINDSNLISFEEIEKLQ